MTTKSTNVLGVQFQVLTLVTQVAAKIRKVKWWMEYTWWVSYCVRFPSPSFGANPVLTGEYIDGKQVRWNTIHHRSYGRTPTDNVISPYLWNEQRRQVEGPRARNSVRWLNRDPSLTPSLPPSKDLPRRPAYLDNHVDNRNSIDLPSWGMLKLRELCISPQLSKSTEVSLVWRKQNATNTQKNSWDVYKLERKSKKSHKHQIQLSCSQCIHSEIRTKNYTGGD